MNHFISEWMIFDNAMVAFETIYSMWNKRYGHVGQMGIKLDMAKAYDRLEWRYLAKVMVAMGFPSRWVMMIQHCVSTVSYFVIVNGTTQGEFHPTLGICQRDLILPYLFLLGVEGLYYLQHNSKVMGRLQGVQVGMDQSPINLDQLIEINGHQSKK